MAKEIKGEKVNPEILLVEKIIKELNQINGELDALLYKIPLAGHHDIARLDYLINRQLQLLE